MTVQKCYFEGCNEMATDFICDCYYSNKELAYCQFCLSDLAVKDLLKHCPECKEDLRKGTVYYYKKLNGKIKKYEYKSDEDSDY